MGAGFGKVNESLGAAAHPIENFMPYTGAQHYERKEKLESKSTQNTLIGEVSPILTENKRKE